MQKYKIFILWSILWNRYSKNNLSSQYILFKSLIRVYKNNSFCYYYNTGFCYNSRSFKSYILKKFIYKYKKWDYNYNYSFILLQNFFLYSITNSYFLVYIIIYFLPLFYNFYYSFNVFLIILLFLVYILYHF